MNLLKAYILDHSNLLSTKDVYLSSANIIWSNTDMSIILPASNNFLVMAISSLDGSGLPLGWLWANIICAQVATIAPLKTSLG